MDGFEVMPMSQAAKIGDMFVTCTGMTSVIRKEHIYKNENGAIMGNVGHFDVEIDSEFLLKSSKSVREVRPNLDECTLKNGKIVYLIGQGRLANLVCSRRASTRSYGSVFFKSNSISSTHSEITIAKWKTR